MTPAIYCRCVGCHARIKAPAQLLDEIHSCPGCGTHLLVRPEPPADSDSLLAKEYDPRRRVIRRAG